MKRSEFLRLGLLALAGAALPLQPILKTTPKHHWREYKISSELLNDKEAFGLWCAHKNVLGKIKDFQIGWLNDDIVNDLLTVRIKYEKLWLNSN